MTQDYIITLVSMMWPATLYNFFSELLVVQSMLSVVFLVLHLKSVHQFKTLSDIVGYDIPGKSFRFGLTYIFLSTLYNCRVQVVTKIPEKISRVTSCTFLFPGAGWLEREVWDFFGIQFVGNLDLRRILTDYGFYGFPLRKDFPLMGFFDTGYSELINLVLKSFIALSQEHKNYYLATN